MNFDLKKIDAVVAAQNEKLLAKKKVFETELTSRDGEKYTVNYIAEDWLIEKKKGRTSSYYQLHKTITNGVGKTVELVISLSDDEVEYINYHKNNVLSSLAGNSSMKQIVRTRFVYGIGSNGSPYIRYQVLIADRIRKSDFTSDLKTEILLDSCTDSKTALNVVLEKVTPLEEKDDDDIKML